jgi:LDH2 family malate/lactate/ureidoglycolate dehydrogenase
MNEGRSIDPGLALDREGNPTVNPKMALEGLFLPVGEHKGFGLSMVNDALVGLGGAPIAKAAGDHGKVGYFLWALDPSLFGSADEFIARVDHLIDVVITAKPQPGHPPPVYPGQNGARLKAAALASGFVELPESIVRAMDETARKLGIQTPAISA